MFKLGPSPTDTTTTNTPNLKSKKPEQESIVNRNNLQQTYVNKKPKVTYKKNSCFCRTKKEYVDNAVKTAFDLQSPSQTYSSSSKANTDYLDRHLFEKADLDYIPGLDYDLGPVYIPSKIIAFFLRNKER